MVILAIALAVYWHTRGSGDHNPASVGRHVASASSGTTPGGTSSAPASTPDPRTPTRPTRPLPPPTAAERAALLQAIATARSHRTAVRGGVTGATGAPGSDSTATTLDIVDRTGDTSDWEKRALGTLNTLLGQCYDLGRAEDPTLEGTVVVRFKLVGEPQVGGLLESVEIVDENTTITQQTLRDCLMQQLYALELDPPPVGVTVEREVSLKVP